MSIVINRRLSSINRRDRANGVSKHIVTGGKRGLELASCTFFKNYLLIDNLYIIYTYI